ncbi:hypothetical protein BGX27_004076 [Mortierella sp. AM989]|nr:hypothetical protein BGX27_004076 [Mortierella sp. AM989]
MPPERRAFALPPRSPISTSTPTSSSTATSLRGHTPSSLVQLPDSYISSYLSNRHAKEIMLSNAHKRRMPCHQMRLPGLQMKYRDNYRLLGQLQAAHLHRQRELRQMQLQQATSQLHHSLTLPPPASQTPSNEGSSQTPQISEPPKSSDILPHSAPVSDSCDSYVQPSTPLTALNRMPGAWSHVPSAKPTLEHISMNISYDQSHKSSIRLSHRNQDLGWVETHEKEYTAVFPNTSSFRYSLPAALPPQVAKESLERLKKRLHRRRIRAQETILTDLHQGVKSVEAEVHRQVDMVLSRLKEAPASKYAFALTNSFLAQIPTTLSNGLSTTAGEQPSPMLVSPLSPPPSPQPNPGLIPATEGGGESTNSVHENGLDGIETALSLKFDSIALAARSNHKRRSLQPTVAHIGSKESQVSISSSGASEVLSASMRTSYTTACSQVLSAALPSFIPTMVAPLVCVFAYPDSSTTTDHSVEDAGDSAMSGQQQRRSSKELSFPWGVPGRSPFHSISVSQDDHHQKQRQQDQLNSGTLILNSKSWTQVEREALNLAATRFQLSGKWSKIREMMNLHRSDEEIEAEYTRLYGHREDKITDIDEDDEDDEQYRSINGDADDEAEGENSAVYLFGRRQQYHCHQQQGIEIPRIESHVIEKEPIRLFKKELMIDKRFTLEEIPTRL